MTASSRRQSDETDEGDEAGDLGLLGEVDLHLFAEGTHARMYDKLGAHPGQRRGQRGIHFAVWAPNAASVDVIGDWNAWQPGLCPLRPARDSGVWHGFAADVPDGNRYKYRVRSRRGDYAVDKADPYAFAAEMPPATASVVTTLDFDWGDDAWMNGRAAKASGDAPLSIYEVHLGSWMRAPTAPDRPLGYRELAGPLVEHVRRMGFSHVELMPIAEQGFFAPTARHGSPQDFMFFVDALHLAGIGVILDWTPAHFPTDEHGLIYFEGTLLDEHADPRLGGHPEWVAAIFNDARAEVRSFLLSNATFWLDRYHIDGLRVDDGVIAEDSTAWPRLTVPVDKGGLGFAYKWNVGWRHDTLAYFARDPLFRRHHHDALIFRGLDATSEAFVLPLSHDEVVHGKRSLLEKMPGDDWQKFATLRLLYAYMWAVPGKKLLFQGGEIGQRGEWSHDRSVDWHLLRESPRHAQVQLLVSELNRFHREEPALHELDADPAGFAWLEANDAELSVYAFLRRGRGGARPLVAVFNCTPVPRANYRVGVPRDGAWTELLNTDGEGFGGSNHGNFGAVEASPVPAHGQSFSLNLSLPPLSALYFVPFA